MKLSQQSFKYLFDSRASVTNPIDCRVFNTGDTSDDISHWRSRIYRI